MALIFMQRKAIMKPGIILASPMSGVQREHFCNWLRANGINPNGIPLYARIISHGNRITYKQARLRQRRDGGKTIAIDANNDTIWDTKTTRIRVPFEPTK